jgi:hypothetical protein
MNDHDIDRLACALNVLRPDWPAKSIRTLLARPQLAGRPLRDVAVAMAWVACEPATSNPGRVLEAGPWWRAVAVEGDSVRLEHLAPQDRCKTCGKSRDRCEANPWGGHAFEADVFTPRDVDLTPVITEVKSHRRPMRPRTEPTPPPNPEVSAAREALHEEEAHA